MILLLAVLAAILCLYVLLVYFTVKRFIPWRYKAFIYGTLTFFMLIGVFLAFASYDRYWKG